MSSIRFGGVPGPSTEALRNYRPNGFHPVHLGDIFSNGRYTVVHKLGHGRSSTTWLALDNQAQTYVSLKIVEAGRIVTEVQVLQHLAATYDATEEGSQHVGRMLDSFIHEGPNGQHQCIVGEVFGATLGSDMVWGYLWEEEALPLDIVRRLSGQIALGVRYLHRRGVAHGDLHTGNMLLCIPNSWTCFEDVTRDIGIPQKLQRNDSNSQNINPHVPQYIVRGVAFNPTLLGLCLTKANVKICDFSESYIPGLSTIPKVATPYILRPPEALLDTAPHATTELDIWALAGSLYMLLAFGVPPFPYGLLGFNPDRMIQAMVLRLGKFPEPMWSKWTARSQFFDEDGRSLDPQAKSRPIVLASRDFPMRGEEEMAVYEALLRSMMRYQAHTRISAEELVESP